MATAMVACTDDYTDWASPIQNQEEAAKSVSVSVTSVPTIDFKTVTGETVKIFTPSVTAEGEYTSAFDVTFANGTMLKANSQGEVNAEELKDVLVAINGKRPVEHEYAVTIVAYVGVGTLSIQQSAATTVTAQLYSPVVIEDQYYLVTNADGAWDWANAVPFIHSSADVYDDPAFSLIVPAPVKADGSREDLLLAVAPQSVKESGDAAALMGSAQAADESLSGTLTETAGKAIKMPATDGAKFYKVELDMETRAYTISVLAFDEFVYLPGNHQSWNPETAPALQSPNFDGVYTGYSYLDGGFKFTKKRTWSDGEYNSTHFPTMEGGLTPSGSDTNILADEAGFYMITADIPSGKLSLTPLTWSIIGAVEADVNWDKDLELKWNAADASWSVTADLVPGEFKFRANHEWGINFGGSFEELQRDGGNLSIAEAGKYEVKLFLTRSASEKIYCTVTKQ